MSKDNTKRKSDSLQRTDRTYVRISLRAHDDERRENPIVRLRARHERNRNRVIF